MPEQKPKIKKTEAKGQVSTTLGFDLTIYETVKGKTYTHLDIGEMLKQVANKFVFQLEEGEEKKKHFQIRLRTIKRTRDMALLKLVFASLNITDAKAFIFCRPTITEEFKKGSFNYVMKAEGRIAGPWTDKDFAEDAYVWIPTALRGITPEQLRPFQRSLLEMSLIPHDRTIDIIYDPKGNNGKGFLKRWLHLNKDCHPLPSVDDYKLITQDAHNAVSARIKKYGVKSDNRNIKAFILDLPRAMKLENMNNLICAIETVKDGYYVDYRNRSSFVYIDPPRVFIFTNTIVDLDYSKDRFKTWRIDEHEALIPFDFPKEKAYYEYEPAKPTTRILYGNDGVPIKVAKKRDEDEDDDAPPVLHKKKILYKV